MDIFVHADYLAVIRAKIAENSAQRGYQSVLAAAAKCQKSQFSQVLAGKMHLSLDHGALLAETWGLLPAETQYFLALISLARAGSPPLRRALAQQLALLREEATDLRQRFRATALEQERRGKLETEYYLSWNWQWLHVLTGLDSPETLASLARRTGLAAGEVADTLRGLEELALVRREGDRWLACEANLHLQKSSALIVAYHLIHRHRAAERIQRDPTAEGELHFSALLSLDQPTYDRFVERMRALLAEFRAAAITAAADRACAVAIDIFGV